MPGVRQSLGCGRVPEQGMPNLSPRHSPANLMSFQDLCLPRLAHARTACSSGRAHCRRAYQELIFTVGQGGCSNGFRAKLPIIEQESCCRVRCRHRRGRLKHVVAVSRGTWTRMELNSYKELITHEATEIAHCLIALLTGEPQSAGSASQAAAVSTQLPATNALAASAGRRQHARPANASANA